MAPILAHSFCGNYPDMAIRALADLRLSAACSARSNSRQCILISASSHHRARRNSSSILGVQ
jgi:hypothetical protein